MKQLAERFNSDGFAFKMLKRIGQLAIFVKQKPDSEDKSFEVVRIRQNKERIMAGQTIPACESMPPSTRWGTDGWTYNTIEDAETRLANLSALKKGDKPAVWPHLYSLRPIGAALAMLVSLFAFLTPARAQTDDVLAIDIAKLESDFAGLTVSNFVFIGGVSYQEQGWHNCWGGVGLIGYNLPKIPVPFVSPYFVPLIGAHYLGGSWYSVSGNASLQADYHPLRFIDGGSTNNFFHKFTLTPNVMVGVGQNVSGQQFGKLKIPGRAANGQGTAAITGYGVSMHVASIGRAKIGLWVERTSWTTVVGKVDEGGLDLTYRF
jgi:hypothetical protein